MKNNCMPTYYISQMKWKNSQEDTNYGNDSGRNGKSKQTCSNEETEPVVKTLPMERSPGPDDFTGKFFQMFKEELASTL